ncbi:MAG: hypothetical protein RL385_1913 [Pseudomonadota bacterium]
MSILRAPGGLPRERKVTRASAIAPRSLILAESGKTELIEVESATADAAAAASGRLRSDGDGR